MDNEVGRLGPVFVSGWHVDGDLAVRVHLLFDRVERLVIARENLAVRERHRELENFALGIPSVGKVRVDLVFGADREASITVLAGILDVCFGRARVSGQEADE